MSVIGYEFIIITCICFCFWLVCCVLQLLFWWQQQRQQQDDEDDGVPLNGFLVRLDCLRFLYIILIGLQNNNNKSMWLVRFIKVRMNVMVDTKWNNNDVTDRSFIFIIIQRCTLKQSTRFSYYVLLITTCIRTVQQMLPLSISIINIFIFICIGLTSIIKGNRDDNQNQ